MSMNIKFIQQLIERMPERVIPELSELDSLALRTNREIRTLLFELRPLALQTQGLVPALEQYVERLGGDALDATLIVDPRLNLSRGSSNGLPESVPTASRQLHPEIEATVFTIVQEAVNNSKKHARAQKLVIELRADGETHMVASVQDDGRGFNLVEVERSYDQRGSFGLLNMRERAELVQGICEIQSQPGRGTTVAIRVPLELQERRSQTVLDSSNQRLGL